MAKSATTTVRPSDAASLKETHRPKLDHHKKEMMLATMIRNIRAYEACESHLSPLQLQALMPGKYNIVWRRVLNYYSEFGTLPGRTALLAELHDFLGTGKVILSEDEAEALDDFIDFIFDDEAHGCNLAKSKSSAAWAIKICKQLLEEGLTNSIKTSLVMQEMMYPAELPDMIRGFTEQIDKLSSIGGAAVTDIFHEGWDKRATRKLIPFGLKALDRFTGKGLAGGESALFMGPFGSCKTTLAVQICSSMAKYANDLYTTALAQCTTKKERSKVRRPVVVMISTEMDAPEFRDRFLVHHAFVPRKVIEKMKSVEELSKSKTPKTPSEQRMFEEDIQQGSYCSRYDRVLAAAIMANSHILFIECTGNNELYPQLGSGGVKELAAVVRAECDRRKVYPIMFVLDHVSALADRIVEGKDGDHEKHLRHALRSIPRQCRDFLNRKFNAPMLLMHQLSGAANSKSPLAELDHTDAAECKSVAEFVDFAVVCGKPTEDANQYCAWRCTKHRRTAPSKPAVMSIDGVFNRVIDCTDRVIADPSRRAFVTIDEAHQIGMPVDVEGKKGNGKKMTKLASDKKAKHLEA